MAKGVALPGVDWKSLFIPVYLPSFLLSFGSGLLVPTLPLYARSFELSYSLISLVVASRAIGTILADIPAGFLVARYGRRSIMLIGVGTVSLSVLGSGFAGSAVELILYQGIAGIGSALWGISRHTYIMDLIQVHERGRALSIFGGIARFGTLMGPAAGGIIGQRWGLSTPFFFEAAIAALVLGLVAGFIPEPVSETPYKESGHVSRRAHVKSILQTYRQIFATAGVAYVCVQMARSGRYLITPLYGAAVLGLDVESIGLIISLSALVDLTLFPVAGQIMDRHGRKYAMIPAFTIMGIGFALIPFTGSFFGLLAAQGVIGLGNGLGSGTMMTLGSDLAPAQGRGEFLGVWRFIGDVGGASGPLAFGRLSDLFGLASGAFLLAGVSVFSSIVFLFFVKETRQHIPP
ncbi:MAG: MFS transporter [candidate division Zixibacteria bacterium]|nr:MFS transporter [candidate division Zixibacteria bacterium]